MSALTVFFGCTPLNVAALREWSPPVSPGPGIEEVASSPLMTVMESLKGSSGCKMKGRSPSGPSDNVQCAGSQPCGLKMPTNRGRFTVASALANGTSAGYIDFSIGRDSATPAPRRNVRRGMCFFVINMLSAILRFAVHLERHAFDDFEDHCRQLVIAFRRLPDNRPDVRHICIFHATAKGICQKLLRECSGELRGVALERLTQAHNAVQFASIDEHTRRVYRLSSIFEPPFAGRIEVFESKTDRIHHLVTACTGGIRAVLFHPLPHGLRPGGGAWFEWRNAGRRIRRMSSQNIFHDPLATEDW